MLDGAERQARAVIAEWPDGAYEGVAHLDDDGRGVHDIHIRARVTVRGSDLGIDLSDSHPQVLGFVNSSYPNMRSAVAMALAGETHAGAEDQGGGNRAQAGGRDPRALRRGRGMGRPG